MKTKNALAMKGVIQAKIRILTRTNPNLSGFVTY
jgi:hypothetical protein